MPGALEQPAATAGACAAAWARVRPRLCWAGRGAACWCWSTADNRRDSFRKCGISHKLCPENIDRSRWPGVCSKQALLAVSESQAPERFDVKEPEHTVKCNPTGGRAAQLEYYKRLNTEKDRVIVALKETPALPTALLKAPLLKIEKRSRR